MVGVAGSLDLDPYGVEDIRDALCLAPDVPIMLCDVRRREVAKNILVVLVEHAVKLSGSVLPPAL